MSVQTARERTGISLIYAPTLAAMRQLSSVNFFNPLVPVMCLWYRYSVRLTRLAVLLIHVIAPMRLPGERQAPCYVQWTFYSARDCVRVGALSGVIAMRLHLDSEGLLWLAGRWHSYFTGRPAAGPARCRLCCDLQVYRQYNGWSA